MQIRCQKGTGTNAQMLSLVFEYLFFHHYQKIQKKKKSGATERTMDRYPIR